MAAKMTSKSPITIPQVVAPKLRNPHSDARQEAGSLVLTPVNPDAAAQVRSRLDKLGITEDDISAAVAWAREPR